MEIEAHPTDALYLEFGKVVAEISKRNKENRRTIKNIFDDEN
jgi:hypothetical protein